MPKVTAVEDLGNFEVLKWVRDTRKRHAEEDRQLEAAGVNVQPRPANLKKALDRHERHLTRDIYPYDKNPSFHNENYGIDDANNIFNEAIFKKLFIPIQKNLTAKVIVTKELRKAEAQDKWDEVTDPKTLTEMELMQLHNLAPTTIEGLQLIIESWEERFTMEEMGQILEVIAEVFRPDEPRKAIILPEVKT